MVQGNLRSRGLLLLLPLLLASCGIVSYPGQPGVVTNSYSKIDMEMIEQPGLFVYEVVYDNGPGGKGVGAIVTKLYPGARTYTSNARTNADGTLYRVKAQYEGALVQMIALPALNQIQVPPDSQVQFLVGYDYSLDEVDDRNIAEAKIFSGTARASEGLWHRAKRTLKWIQAGALTRSGRLAYTVEKVGLGDKEFTPSSAVTVETSLLQNSVLSNLSSDVRKQAAEFLEKHYPKGYKGNVVFHLSNGKRMEVGALIHTLTTAQAAGIQVSRDLTQERAQEILEKYASR